MSPLRRSRPTAARSAPYSCRGWLSRCRRARRVLDGDGNERPLEHGITTTSALQDDALAAVFARLRDEPAVVRCAAKCRRWLRVVGREAASLSRALPPRGSLALGFFHRDDVASRQPAARCPIFIPTTFATRLLGFHGASSRSLLEGVHVDGGVDLECSRPVACRNGRLVLELARDGRADGLRLCICNPMTGDAHVLPALSGDDWPGYYACALLTGEDVDPPVFSPAYFRLLLVYNRRGFTALRRYSSDTASWGHEAKADVRISNRWLRNMVQATALRGVVYWPLAWHVLGVRLDVDGTTMEQSYGSSQPTQVNNSRYHTIGVSPEPEGRLWLVALKIAGHFLAVRTFTFRNDGSVGRRWEAQEPSKVIRLNQFKIEHSATMACRWYCEKSGVLFFTLGQGSSIRGTFALNLVTKELEKCPRKFAEARRCGGLRLWILLQPLMSAVI